MLILNRGRLESTAVHWQMVVEKDPQGVAWQTRAFAEMQGHWKAVVRVRVRANGMVQVLFLVHAVA